MIFSSGWVPISFGNWIAVYSGTQPSMADYIANYETLYSFTGSELLQVVLPFRFTSDDGESSHSYGLVTWHNGIITDPEVQGYTQGLYSIRAGEGTWGTIRQKNNAPRREELEGYYALSESEVESLFLSEYSTNTAIVPISDLTDTGVIKFNSTLFSHPDSDQEDRALDLSIIASL